MSMPLLYDKQWYENAADGIQSGLNDGNPKTERYIKINKARAETARALLIERDKNGKEI